MVEGNKYVFANELLVVPYVEINRIEFMSAPEDLATVYLDSGALVIVTGLVGQQIARGLCDYHEDINTPFEVME